VDIRPQNILPDLSVAISWIDLSREMNILQLLHSIQTCGSMAMLYSLINHNKIQN